MIHAINADSAQSQLISKNEDHISLEDIPTISLKGIPDKYIIRVKNSPHFLIAMYIGNEPNYYILDPKKVLIASPNDPARIPGKNYRLPTRISNALEDLIIDTGKGRKEEAMDLVRKNVKGVVFSGVILYAGQKRRYEAISGYNYKFTLLNSVRGCTYYNNENRTIYVSTFDADKMLLQNDIPDSFPFPVLIKYENVSSNPIFKEFLMICEIIHETAHIKLYDQFKSKDFRTEEAARLTERYANIYTKRTAEAYIELSKKRGLDPALLRTMNDQLMVIEAELHKINSLLGLDKNNYDLFPDIHFYQ